MSQSNVLAKFLDEHDDSVEESNQKSGADSKETNHHIGIKGGDVGVVLIGGSVEWDNQANKSVSGLDLLHRMDFPKLVRKVYSSSSASHTFFVLADDSIFALGKNDSGQLGVDHKESVVAPVRVKLTGKVVKISAGRSHSLFLMDNGELFGCGNNSCGQVGLAASKIQLTPKKIPITGNVRDIACGYEFSVICDSRGFVYTFGHPENGQLGHGSNGEFLKDSGSKGPAVQYAHVTTPRRIETFVSKDAHGKVKYEINCRNIRIRAVAAGKNHAICVEDWEQTPSESSSEESTAYTPLNRLFSWGFGGYGRLGHNDSKDEYTPREISFFSFYPANNPMVPSVQSNKQKQVRELICGSTFSIAVTVSKHFYFWGKMSNSPRGEASVYPKMQQELYDWPVEVCAAGPNLILVASNKIEGQRPSTSSSSSSSNSSPVSSANTCIGWGQPVAGKIGFEDDSRSSTNPKFMTALKGLRVLDISCGYGHVCYLVEDKVSDGTPADGTAASSAPTAVPKSKAASASKKSAAAAGSSKEGGSFGPVLSAFPVLESAAVEVGSKKRGNEGKSKAAAPSKKGKK